MREDIDKLIKLGLKTKNKPYIFKYGYEKLIQEILDELKKMRENSDHAFSDLLVDSIVDSFLWDDPFIQALWAYLEKRNHKQKTRT